MGRSHHIGVAQAVGRTSPDGPPPAAPHLSARTSARPGRGARTAPIWRCHVAAAPGDGDDRPGRERQALPAEVVDQIVAKTDGVPLFVEELTKMVLESGRLQEQAEREALTGPLPPLAIPTTLHDSLMARLDRLAAVKGLAQLGATLGREFAYDLLQAVAPWDEATVQQGLHQLVAAELLYQRGLPPHATYPSSTP